MPDSAKQRLMPRRELQARLGMRSANTVRDYVDRGLLTRPIRISDCPTTPVSWPESEIDAIVAARIRGLDDKAVRDLVVALEARRGGST
jgi:predicted DNA-binding transcriptional regulator AlpA